MSFGALSTDERPQPLPDEPELIAKCLAEGIAAQLETAFTFDIEYQQLLARLCFAREHGCHLPALLAPEPQRARQSPHQPLLRSKERQGTSGHPSRQNLSWVPDLS